MECLASIGPMATWGSEVPTNADNVSEKTSRRRSCSTVRGHPDMQVEVSSVSGSAGKGNLGQGRPAIKSAIVGSCALALGLG